MSYMSSSDHNNPTEATMANLTNLTTNLLTAATKVASLNTSRRVALADFDQAFVAWAEAGRPASYLSYLNTMREVANTAVLAWARAA